VSTFSKKIEDAFVKHERPLYPKPNWCWYQAGAAAALRLESEALSERRDELYARFQEFHMGQDLGAADELRDRIEDIDAAVRELEGK
jgi:hypothetical protein